MKSLWVVLKERRINHKKTEELIAKKYKSLSLPDKNAYEQIIDRYKEGSIFFYLMIAIPKAILNFFIGYIVILFGLGINLIEPFQEMSFFLIRLYIPILIFAFFIDFVRLSGLNKLKKKLLNVK